MRLGDLEKKFMLQLDINTILSVTKAVFSFVGKSREEAMLRDKAKFEHMEEVLKYSSKKDRARYFNQIEKEAVALFKKELDQTSSLWCSALSIGLKGLLIYLTFLGAIHLTRLVF